MSNGCLLALYFIMWAEEKGGEVDKDSLRKLLKP